MGYTDEEMLEFVREAADAAGHDRRMVSLSEYERYRDRQLAVGRRLPASTTIAKRFGTWLRAEAEAGVGSLDTNGHVVTVDMRELMTTSRTMGFVNAEAVTALARGGTDLLYSTATCGIVVSQWRDTIEGLHRFFSHAEMAYMSLETCKALQQHIRTYPRLTSPLRWDRIAEIICDDDRPVLMGRRGAEVFPDHWDEVKEEVAARCARAAEEHMGRLGDSMFWGLSICSRWHGAPLWPQLVERFCDAVTPPTELWSGDRSEFRSQLLSNPLALPVELFDWCIHNGLSSIHSPNYVGRTADE